MQQMMSASFTAWQILGAKGLKKSWSAYLKALGLDEKSGNKVDRDEKADILKRAKSLIQKVEKGKR